MKITITFDKNSSNWEDENFEFNKLFVNAQRIYIKELYDSQGYIYLNRIYEILGFKWNPYDENICWVLERDGNLEISITAYDSCCEIRIDIFSKP